MYISKLQMNKWVREKYVDLKMECVVYEQILWCFLALNLKFYSYEINEWSILLIILSWETL